LKHKNHKNSEIKFYKAVERTILMLIRSLTITDPGFLKPVVWDSLGKQKASEDATNSLEINYITDGISDCVHTCKTCENFARMGENQIWSVGRKENWKTYRKTVCWKECNTGVGTGHWD